MRHSRRRLTLAAAGLGLALAAAPYTPMPAQADHCQALLIFSGIQVSLPNGSSPGQPLNPGAAGCVNDDEATNTNLLFPGANFLSVGSFPTPTSEAWVDVDGVVTPLTFVKNAAGTRWDSQRVSLNNAKVATATVKTITGLTVSVTYTATPSTEL